MSSNAGHSAGDYELPDTARVEALATTPLQSLSRSSYSMAIATPTETEVSQPDTPMVLARQPHKNHSMNSTHPETENDRRTCQSHLDRSRADILPCGLPAATCVATLTAGGTLREDPVLEGKQHPDRDKDHNDDHDNNNHQDNDGRRAEIGATDNNNAKENAYEQKDAEGDNPDSGKDHVVFREHSETEGMRLLAETAWRMKDRNKEHDSVIAIIDTGAASSFISKGIVDLYGLKERPLMEEDIKDFANPLSSESCKPDTFVQVFVKCGRAGVCDWVDTSLRVVYRSGFDVIFGRPFIEEHNILARIPKFDSAGNPRFSLSGHPARSRNTLSVLKGSRSEGMKVRVEGENQNADEAIAAQIAYDQSAKKKDKEIALALERARTAGPPLAGPKSETSASSYTRKSTPSWDCMSSRSEPSSMTSWARTSNVERSRKEEHLQK
jgi:hypothetical protein